MKQELDRVHITGHHVKLPNEVAHEMALLWRAMLPGPSAEPKELISGGHKLFVHAPAFIGLVRDDGSVKAGTIVSTAYDKPFYRAFLGILADIGIICDRQLPSTASAFHNLAKKMRALRIHLGTSK